MIAVTCPVARPLQANAAPPPPTTKKLQHRAPRPPPFSSRKQKINNKHTRTNCFFFHKTNYFSRSKQSITQEPACVCVYRIRTLTLDKLAEWRSNNSCLFTSTIIIQMRRAGKSAGQVILLANLFSISFHMCSNLNLKILNELNSIFVNNFC
jgi:hypothetical protein